MAGINFANHNIYYERQIIRIKEAVEKKQDILFYLYSLL